MTEIEEKPDNLSNVMDLTSSNDLDENMLNGSNIYRDRLGITQIHLENYKNIEKIQRLSFTWYEDRKLKSKQG